MNLHVKLQIVLVIVLIIAGAAFFLFRSGPKDSVETIQGRLGSMEEMMDKEDL